MVIVAINTETNGSTPSSFTVTGLGLTWSLRSRNQTFSGRGQSTEVWYALAGSSISGTIALSGSVNTDDGTWHVLFVTGATTPPRWDTNPSLPASAKSPGTQVVSTDAPVPYVLIFAGNGTNSHNSSPTPVSTSLGIVSNGGGTNWEYSDVWGGTPGQLASTTAGCGSVGSFPTVVVDALTQGVNASLALGPLTTHAVITATGTVTVALGPVAISAITTTSTETLALGPLTTTATGMVLQPTRYYCAINSGLAIVDYTLWYSTFFSLQTWGSGSFLGPQSVAVSPDGRWLAITNTGTQVQFGDLTVPLPAPGAAAIAGPIITTGLSSVNAGVWAPDSSKAYFQGAGAVQSSNQTGAVLGPVWTVAGATGLTQLAISTDGTKLYCTCGTSVKQVDTTSGAVTATYSGLTGAMGICISPDNTMLYVSDGLTSGNIYPITIATGTVGTPLAANNPQGLCVSPDGSTLWSAQQGSNQVQAIATSSFTVTHTIGSITSPKAIAVARDGTSVLVSTSAANVIPISTSTFTAGAALSVPQAALGISVQPITGRAYCSLGPLFTEANTTVPLSLGPFILESPPVPAPAASGFFAYGAITSGTTLTMTWQPSTAAIVGGHLLLMFIASTTAVPPYTPPAGWTSAGYVSSAGYNAQLFWKTATGPTGSEPSNYTVTMSSSSVSVGVIADYANANQLDGPIGMVSSPAGSSTYTFAGLTTAGFHRKWIGFAGFASGTSPVQPGGTTLEASYHPTTLWDHVYDQTWLVAPPALPIVNNQPNAGNPNPPYVTIDCLIYQGPVQLAPSNLVEGPLSLVAYGTGSCSVPLGPLAVNAIGTVMPPNPIVFCCNGTTSMKVLDAVTGTLVGTLAMARSEYYAAVSPNGHYMAVTSVSDLSQFPPSSTTVQPFVQFVTTTGYGLGNVAIGPILVLGSENLYGLSMAWAADSSKVYVEGQIPGTLGSGGGAIQASSPTGVMTDYAGVNYAQFNGYAVMSPDGQYLYCTGKDGSGTLWIQQVVTLGDANFNSWSGFVGTQLYGICISPDGGTLYVSNGATSGLVYSVNIATGVVTGMSVGNGPMGLALSPDGRTLYCALHGGGQVAVINTFTMAVTQTISGFTNPARVAVTPDGSVLWVTNYTTGNVTPVNTSTFALGTPVSVGSNATDVAIVPAFNGVLGTATLSLGPLTTTAMGIGGTTFCTLGPLVLSATGAVGATAAVRLGPVKVRAGLAVIVAGANASSTHSLMGSADGTTWTIIPNPADGGSYVSVWGVAYNHTNGSWVAVDSGDASTPAKVLMTSPNGTTWTSRSTPFDGDYGQSVVWAEGVWVAAGGSTTSSHSVIATSPDGVTWTARTTPFDGSSGYVNQVGTNFYASPNRLIVAVGNDNAGVKVVMTSPDGVTWTAQTTPFDSGYGAAVWWDGHNWLVGGRNSAKTRTIMTSPNGIVWTLRTTPFDAPKDGTANPAVWDIAGNGAGLLVAVGQAGYHGGPMICTSADHGVTWTARDHPFTHPSGGGAAAPPGWAVAWVPAIGLWVLGSGSAASGPQVVATSPDAITWTAALTPFDGPGPAGSPPVGFVNMINPTGPQTVYPPVPLPAEQGSPGFIPVWD
jgi:YVTN family beta-propeller protein